MRKTVWVIESTPKQLSAILSKSLTEIDDWMQDATDKGNPKAAAELSEGYDTLEKWLRKVQKGNPVSTSDRNQMRIAMKHCFKIAAVASC